MTQVLSHSKQFLCLVSMPNLPTIKGKQLVKLLEKIGFVSVFGKGSHVILKHNDGRRTTVPLHGKELPKGTILAILRDIEISKEELLMAMQEK